jgi:hypothetical protein
MLVASAELTDDDFLAAFNSCRLPLSSFRHGDHLRLAWLLLHRNRFDEALAQVRESIRRFAVHHGKHDLFHETVTTAWVKLLATHSEKTFTEFLTVNEHRLTPALLHRFWTPAVLSSEAAKSHWVPPDKMALPNDGNKLLDAQKYAILQMEKGRQNRPFMFRMVSAIQCSTTE